MATQHVNITDPDIHEPVGASTASTGEVYVSDGAGSGAWSLPIDIITAELTDISTASSAFVVSPYAGTITKIYTVLHSAISVANATLSFEIAGTPITSGGITVAYSGSAAGDVDSSTPSAANAVTAGQAIEIITNGGSTTAARITISFVIQRT